jgi:hypothetical protein
LGNPNLTWETATKENIGADFTIFKELKGSFDYFKEHRTGILLTRNSIPYYAGVPMNTVPLQNMGIVDNHGYEIMLTWNRTVNKDLSFTLTGNFGYNRNKLIFSDEVQLDDSYYYRYVRQGFSLGQYWGYKIDRKNGTYWTSADEIKNSGLTYSFGTPRPGDFKYVDLNHDGVIDQRDLSPIGNTYIPRVNYGGTLTVNYKEFDFTCFISGVGQYSRYRSSNGAWENLQQGEYYSYHLHAWTPERYQNHEQITYPALSTGMTTNHVQNDFFVMNTAFTRLKTLELGYSLKKSMLKKSSISSLRVFVSGQNLFVWQHQPFTDVDPENAGTIDYPVTKNVSMGVNVNF